MPHRQLESFARDLIALPTCFELSPSDLDTSPTCPHKPYRPADYPPNPQSAAKILEGLDGRLDLLVQGWTSTLLENLEDPTVRPNIELLSNPTGKSELHQFLETRKLPEQISSDFVEVIQEALTGLEKVSVKGGNLCEALAKGGLPCTVDELKRRFADYLAKVSKDKDPDKVRVVIE